ncbi:hypothetical protein DTB58_30600, partial [Streptomyces griseus]|nr:hypothetical protein [Streptomyces griseus]
PGPSGRFPSVLLCFAVLRFRLYQTLSCPIPGRSGPCSFAFQVLRFRVFPFRRVRLYQTLFRSVSGPKVISGGLRKALPFGVFTTLADSLGNS